MSGLIFNAVLAALMIFLYVNVGQVSFTKVGTETLGPAGFPRMLIGVILFFLLIITIRDIIKMRKNKAEDKKDEVNVIQKEDKIRVILFSAAMVAYLALLQTVGFIISTIALIFGLIKIIGYKKNWIAILAAVSVSLLIAFVFGELFNVSLPRGIGIFREISAFIY